MRVIYTSKGMSKKFGCALYIRCALSIEKYVKYNSVGFKQLIVVQTNKNYVDATQKEEIHVELGGEHLQVWPLVEPKW